jgi:hypothetical protein
MNKFLQTLWIALFILVSGQVMAQGVTTGSMSGKVSDDKGGDLPGATILAVHEPTGTRYGVPTELDGSFSINNMRVGGPYTITVTMMGYQEKKQSEIYLSLGQNLVLNLQVSESSNTLGEVILTGGGEDDKAGTSTRISNRLINSLPTISRSLNDFTRLTPQANITGDRISFAGQNNRYNQFAIDGTVNNDVFGLNASGTNGGASGTQPVAIDAIDELQVVIAPYDVKQGGFTGGGINAVTRGGTNKFSGSAYYFGRNQTFIGKYDPLTGNERVLQASKFEQFGIRLGGPIIKNKLFFFINAEKTNNIVPLDFAPGVNGSILVASELDQIYNHAKNNLGYDAGTYLALGDDDRSTKYFARLDWNISDKHQLTVRHNFVNATSIDNSRGQNFVNFSNTGVYRPNKTNSFVTELKSRFSNNMSNEFRFGITTVRDDRSSTGANFPNIRINGLTGGANATIGPEANSSANALNQDVFTITNNFTWNFTPKHTLTFGTHNEFYSMSNLFIQNNFGTYTYGSLAAFLNTGKGIAGGETKPDVYNYSYFTRNPSEQKFVDWTAMQLGFYAQDEIKVLDNLKVTAGIRVDLPVFNAQPEANETFNNEFKPLFDVATDVMPKTQIMWSPRVGFSYDLKDDRKTIIRGGVGLFTGRVPFVWMSNQFSNTGTLFTRIGFANSGAVPNGLVFRNDPANQWTIPAIQTLSGQSGFAPPQSNEINVVSKNFKYPQVLRANLAIDQKIFWGITATLEAMYSKTLNDIYYQNLNLKAPNRTLQLPNGATSGDTRPIWSGILSEDLVNPTYTGVYLIDNTNKGESWTFTAQLTKPFDNGFSGSLAYTFGTATNVMSGSSSTALSNWRFSNSVNGPNQPEFARAEYDMKHRVVGNIGYTIKYGDNATSFTLIYNGQSGEAYSHVYRQGAAGGAVSINRESPNTQNDLIYIPRDASEIVFTGTDAQKAAQWEAFNNYIESNKYLRSRRGQYAERNGARTPWENRFDLRIMQDIGLKNSHKLQLTLDIMNVGNFVDRNWGADYNVSNNAYSVLRFDGFQTGTNIPTFTFNETQDLILIDGVRRAYTKGDFFSRWRAQFGVRYSF